MLPILYYIRNKIKFVFRFWDTSRGMDVWTLGTLNSNICLYFLNSYLDEGGIPAQLIDVNIASDYDKLSDLLERCKGIEKNRILEVSEQEKDIVTDIAKIFNPAVEFGERELISMLFYLGYLTISGEEFWMAKLRIPNSIMKELWKS